MAKKKDASMLGPLYTKEGKSLGGSEVAGPTGGKAVHDPLGYMKGGKKGK